MASATGTGRRAGLDRDDVVAAAAHLVERDGAEALTMRKLAAELGVATTTIYWHAGNRDELIVAVISHVADRSGPVTAIGDTVAERVASIAGALWQVSMAHRNVAALAHQVGATGLLGGRYEAAMATELETAGVEAEAVPRVVRAVVLCTAGFLVAGMRPAPAEPATLPDLLEATVRAVVEGLTGGTR